jgi:hypothetical protein
MKTSSRPSMKMSTVEGPSHEDDDDELDDDDDSLD